MNIEKLRDYCLTLPDVTEKMPFEAFFHNHESLLALYVGNRIFCMVELGIAYPVGLFHPEKVAYRSICRLKSL